MHAGSPSGFSKLNSQFRFRERAALRRHIASECGERRDGAREPSRRVRLSPTQVEFLNSRAAGKSNERAPGAARSQIS
jgi:hypothetical protein